MFVAPVEKLNDSAFSHGNNPNKWNLTGYLYPSEKQVISHSSMGGMRLGPPENNESGKCSAKTAINHSTAQTLPPDDLINWQTNWRFACTTEDPHFFFHPIGSSFDQAFYVPFQWSTSNSEWILKQQYYYLKGNGVPYWGLFKNRAVKINYIQSVIKRCRLESFQKENDIFKTFFFFLFVLVWYFLFCVLFRLYVCFHIPATLAYAICTRPHICSVMLLY